MKILALDIAEKTGYAMNRRNASGIWDFKVKTQESKGLRLIKFEKQLEKVYNEWAFDLVAFEAVSSMQHRNATLSLALYHGVLQSWCLKNGVEYTEIYQGDIKTKAKAAHPTFDNGKKPKKDGSRNQVVTKEWIVEAARKKFKKIEIIDDNHADALWILEIAKERYA